jgi:hypothetical protein
MSKVNPEPNVIHIMGCYILGNPNGEKVLEPRPEKREGVTGTSFPSSTLPGKPPVPELSLFWGVSRV